MQHMWRGRHCISEECGCRNSSEYDVEASMTWLRWYRPLLMLLVFTYALFVIKMPRLWKRKLPCMEAAIFFWDLFNAFADLYLLILLLPEFLWSFRGGLYSSVCLNDNLYKNARTGHAIFTFHISKTWELLDTVLVILDGHDTATLHVAHHIVSCVSALYSYHSIGALARWIAITNLASHCILY
ncbi:unnamed protein product, partial [Gongylonema pulchrum]|uniref:Elongation of very long chain fatty acids protein n=1 Tax=Gongylonema pulchrum TaxID=637853 RepID=A0A183F1E2_9BILA